MKMKKNQFQSPHYLGNDFFEKLWHESWIYVKTVFDASKESILILDQQLSVIVANKSFYQTFQVEKKDTEGKKLSLLGNGEWNIPALHKLLNEILSKDTSLTGFEVAREFPGIGSKTMLLSARQMYYRKDSESEAFLPVILIAFEDITDLVSVAESFVKQLNQQHQPD